MRISKRVLQKNKKHIKFPEKFGFLCFLVTPVLRFAVLPYYRQIASLFYYRRNCFMKATVPYSYFQSRPLQQIHSFSNFDTPRAGFGPEQNLISDSGTNENIQCLVVLIKTTTKIFNFN